MALVIGNSAYRNVPELPNPANDASDMEAKLRSLDFDIIIGRDLDLDGVRAVIREFVAKLDGADIALFYYAGHGLQVNGENYIAPVDATLLSYIDLEFEAVPMNMVLSAMERQTHVNLVFLDACRDNPLAVNLARSMGTRSFSIGRGLAKVGSGIGSLIAFATQPGNVALDGVGRNSPFTAALLRHLGKPGRDITRELIDVRRDVLEATDGKQVPWDSSSLTGEVVLKPLVEQESTTGNDPKHDNAAELVFWETIKASSDRNEFDAYLQQYPNGAFVKLAKAKIRNIEKLASDEAVAKLETSPDGAAQPQTPGVGVPASAGRVAALNPQPDESDVERDRDLARSIQKELNRVGCRAGNEDGLWGAASRRALSQFAKNRRFEIAALEPSVTLLEQLRMQKIRICPLICDSNHQERDGRCVAIQAPAKRTIQTPVTPPTKTQKASLGTCPTDAHIAAREAIPRGSGRGRTAMTLTHSCGRDLSCRRPGRGMRWSCSWL
ncbi:caspase family protein [Rhizobium grahamii]|uniref:caspase family protein n=1 Tax=Rhizobium grahamii TaxID=1120045 RepID=UPI001FCFD120|nr:caspase family protein [Rhizobium grahamii]